jgi:crotonobetainyl-CoA:carnitine CoA-transferase CaiB-like acyl-CoA transferase
MAIVLQQRIRAALAKPMGDDRSLDPLHELEDVLQGVGLNLESAGGSIRFAGKDPIISSPLPLATMAGVGLMAKAVAVADIWRLRTGQGQDLSLNLGQVLHRLCPFYDKKWELLNGYAPGAPSDPASPFMPSFMYMTRDDRWVQFINIYPRAKSAALAFLGCHDDPRAVGEAIRKWNALELEEAANRSGLQATVVRSVDEFFASEQYPYLEELPLIEIEKIGESAPIPFSPAPTTPLDGIRALGLGHVIAGSGLGRALAYHGADVFWRPLDFEMDVVYYTANVGMRSAILDIGKSEPMGRFRTLLKEADVFFANRRPSYLAKLDLTAEAAAVLRPGRSRTKTSNHAKSG